MSFSFLIVDYRFRLLVGSINNQKSPISNSLDWQSNNNAGENTEWFHLILLYLI